jgi:putative ABC transport system permease protein
MSIVWKKIWRDLSLNKTRTILAVLSTAVGVFALGFVINMADMMNRSIRTQTLNSQAANIHFFAEPITSDQVESVRTMTDVAGAEAVINSYVRWRREGDTDWRDASLTGRTDFENQSVSLLDKTEGIWPGAKDLVMEEQTMVYFGLKTGDRIVIEHGNTSRLVEIVGVVRSTQTVPPQYQGSQGAFFATPETVEWLTGSADYNQLNVRLKQWDKTRAEQIGGKLEEQFKQAGLSTGGFTLEKPGYHFSQQILDGIIIILTGMGIISLGLSAFLIINTLNALMAQQIWQIGIFKVVGATFGRIMRIYLGVALLYGFLALLIAVPLSMLGAQVMSTMMLGTINVASSPMRFVPAAVIIQIVVGLIVPLLAALFPVIGGARVSCHQAISNYGLGGGFGNSFMDRVLLGAQQKIPAFRSAPRPMLLSLRNTFRRKTRVMLTLATLTLGGVMFITVMGVGLSLNRMLDNVIDDFGFNIMMSFDHPEQTEKLTRIASSVPGVTMAEAWDIREASLKMPGGEEKFTQLWALPPDSSMFHFNIAAGRSLLPGDDRAILINRKVAQENGLHVGDTVTLVINGRESEWTIAGLIINMNNGQRDSFVPLQALTRVMGSVNHTTSVAVSLAQGDPVSEKAAIDQLQEKFIAEGLNPANVIGVNLIRETNKYQFNLLVNILLTMAVLAAIVGSLGLAGTMSINVMERKREIGMMRAIGAASPTVAGIFIGEGLLIGVISWLLAIPFSIPGGILMDGALSEAIVPVNFAFSIQGAFTWLVIVSVLAVIASLWPAIRATRISVRESLAYE